MEPVARREAGAPMAARRLPDIVAAPMRALLRRPWPWPVLLTACVNFHPLHPPAPPGAAPQTATAGAGAPLAKTPATPAPAWHLFGESVQGRPLRCASYGTGSRRVLWIGGIHGNEREGRVATAELPAALLAMPGGGRAVTLTVVDDVNPDGSALGVRGNVNGVDLNRNYPAENFSAQRVYGMRPLSQPESRALHDLILSLQPHLVIVAHSWGDDHFINYDGPARGLAERFQRLSGYRLRESDDIAPTPGSLGSWVGNTLRRPILTLEYRRGRDPWAAWQETKNAILSVTLDG